MLAPIVEIFCDIDDFCKEFLQGQSLHMLPNPERKRKRYCRLSLSEIMTIEVLFHLSHYRTFKDYYLECVMPYLRDYFPDLVSYNRFVEIKSQVIPLLVAYGVYRRGIASGLYYVDSTSLKVCRNQRIRSHKVFQGLAERGKSSMGWFFGFKLHLVINHVGEIMSWCLTPGNVDDRQPLETLFKKLNGLAFGDKGYLSKHKAQALEQTGITLITKVRRNMKRKAITSYERFLLAQRSVVETVIDQLKSLCQIEHSRHRSPDNFLVNLMAAIVAYAFKPKKPQINQHKINQLNMNLMSN